MSSTIYRQYDSRWASKPYPNTKSLFGGNGCGCCAVLHLLLESHPSWTPETIRPYMVSKGFAYPGQGTTWGGITETMRHYGLTNVSTYWDYSTNVTKAIADLKRGNRMGIILFSGGAAGSKGTVWTTGGHYVAFTSFKQSNGKNYFYMKDSGARKHDGWFSYEEHMRGKVAKIWVCDKPKSSTPQTKGFTGVLPNAVIRKGNRGTNVIRWQGFLRWYFSSQKSQIAQDGIFGAITDKYTRQFQKEKKLVVDGIVGAKTIASAKSVRK